MLNMNKVEKALMLEPEEMRVRVKVLRFGNGNIDTLKGFLYRDSSVREDGFKLISMHEDSSHSLDIEMEGTTVDVLHEYAIKNATSIEVECIYKDGRTEIYTFPRR